MSSPQEFLLGLTKGTSSLVKNSVYGVFNTTTKIAGSLGQGVAALSFDPQYKRERQLMHREKPRHFAEGVAFGMRDLGIGLFKGLTGIVQSPIEGAMSEGVTGAVKGIARGVQGVYVKPTVGALDLVTRTTEGIRNTTTYFDEKDRRRVRAPRFFGPDKILHQYDGYKAEGQEYLFLTEEGKYKSDWYIHHFHAEGFVLVISNRRLIYLRAKTTKEEWSVQITSKIYLR